LGTLGIIPAGVKRYINLITQQYQGNVTIVPVPSIYDYMTLMKVIKNPTWKDL